MGFKTKSIKLLTHLLPKKPNHIPTYGYSFNKTALC